jgi:hypothetical protein
MSKKVFIFSESGESAIRAEDIVSVWVESNPREKYNVLARVKEGNSFDDVYLLSLVSKKEALRFLRAVTQEIEEILGE